MLLRLAEWELGLRIKIKAAINDQRVIAFHLKTDLANGKRFSSLEVHQLQLEHLFHIRAAW